MSAGCGNDLPGSAKTRLAGSQVNRPHQILAISPLPLSRAHDQPKDLQRTAGPGRLTRDPLGLAPKAQVRNEQQRAQPSATEQSALPFALPPHDSRTDVGALVEGAAMARFGRIPATRQRGGL